MCVCVCTHTIHTRVCTHMCPTLQMTDPGLQNPCEPSEKESAEHGSEDQRGKGTYGRSHGL